MRESGWNVGIENSKRRRTQNFELIRMKGFNGLILSWLIESGGHDARKPYPVRWTLYDRHPDYNKDKHVLISTDGTPSRGKCVVPRSKIYARSDRTLFSRIIDFILSSLSFLFFSFSLFSTFFFSFLSVSKDHERFLIFSHARTTSLSLSLSLSLCEYPSRCGCGRCTRGYFNQACLFNGCNAAFICPPFSSCLRAPLSKLHFILALQIVTGVKKRPAFDRSSPPSFESHGKRSVV